MLYFKLTGDSARQWSVTPGAIKPAKEFDLDPDHEPKTVACYKQSTRDRFLALSWSFVEYFPNHTYEEEYVMDVVYRCCSGVDVHKKSMKVQLRRKGVAGKKDLNEVRTFRTLTRDLLALTDWLTREGCTHVAMECTGNRYTIFSPPQTLKCFW